MWVRSTLDGQADLRVFSESTDLDNNPLFNIGTDNTGATGQVDQFIRNGATIKNHFHTVTEAFVLNEWHHIAWTTDVDGVTKIYIDGILDPGETGPFDYPRQVWNHKYTTIGCILRATPCR